ncbi:hypothetical protein NE237_012108 [Protea cynaroides]|uniref:Uncharacterized protein n=1 Tax=Protea cynaroides TaxID=273540 RepID=A0A9Q0JYI5_9MAGN|nr:hypothetical protein NE237_012108 [Protea cynaroides]
MVLDGGNTDGRSATCECTQYSLPKKPRAHKTQVGVSLTNAFAGRVIDGPAVESGQAGPSLFGKSGARSGMKGVPGLGEVSRGLKDVCGDGVCCEKPNAEEGLQACQPVRSDDQSPFATDLSKETSSLRSSHFRKSEFILRIRSSDVSCRAFEREWSFVSLNPATGLAPSDIRSMVCLAN